MSVIICTWNRASLLERVLIELTKLYVPPGLAWELVIVNNNCTDSTSEVLRKFQGHLPLREVFESQQGLSLARNRGLLASTGKLILWTDDDVLADSGWMNAYVSAAKKWPEAAFFGGPIQPRFDGTPPSWLLPNLALLCGMLLKFDYETPEGEFQDGGYPFGANMAMRRNLFDEGAFDPRFGKIADEQILGEEAIFFQRVRTSGKKGVWVPTAKIDHWISRDRMTLRFAWHWHIGSGRTAVRMEGLPEWPRFRWFPPRLYWVARACVLGTACVFQRIFCRRGWFKSYVGFARVVGMLWGSLEALDSR